MTQINKIIQQINQADKTIGFENNDFAVSQLVDEIINSDKHNSRSKSIISSISAMRDFNRLINIDSYLRMANYALKLDKRNWRALFVLAFDSLYRGNLDDHGSYLQQALSFSPSNRKLMTALCNYSLALHKPDILKKHLSLIPENLDKDYYQEFHSKLEQFSAKLPETFMNQGKKLIMLGGVSHCGSTFLGNFFAIHKNAEYLGESHRIALYSNEDRSRQSKERNLKFILCNKCQSTECSQYPDEFRESLRQDKLHYYYKVAQKCSGSIIIFGDKNFHISRTLAPKADFDEIVLFKKPVNAYQSHYKHRKVAVIEEREFKSINDYFKIYIDNYSNFLLGNANAHQQIFMNWESFTANPEPHMKRLSELVGMKLDLKKFNQLSHMGHSFGGNHGVNDALSIKETKLKVAKTNVLPDNLVAAASENYYANMVYERLMKKYHKDFDIN